MLLWSAHNPLRVGHKIKRKLGDYRWYWDSSKALQDSVKPFSGVFYGYKVVYIWRSSVLVGEHDESNGSRYYFMSGCHMQRPVDIKTHWHMHTCLTYSAPAYVWHLSNDAIRSHNIQMNILGADVRWFIFTLPILIRWCMYSSGLAAFVNWHVPFTPHCFGACICATYQYNSQPFGCTYLAIKVSFKAKFEIDTYRARWPLMSSFFKQMHM